MNAELLLDCKNTLAEGILWEDRSSCLYWSDIEERRLYRFDTLTGTLAYRSFSEKLGSFAFTDSGGFLFAFSSGPALGSWESDELQWLGSRLNPGSGTGAVNEKDGAVRLNDGRCDRQGRFIVGDYDRDTRGRGSVYRVTADGSVTPLFGGLNSANSTCFSPDGTKMYFTDSPEKVIWVYDYDTASGTPYNRRLFVSLADQPGLPDGSVVDAEGYLWNAQWAGSRIVRYSPAGEIDRVIEFPVRDITCLCFGGEHLDTLYVTTARNTLTTEQLKERPLSGGIFSVKVDVHGLRENRFPG